MFLLGLIDVGISGPGMSERLQKRVDALGIWGAFCLGVLFALTFCPISGALFFLQLIPQAAYLDSPIGMPALYGIGNVLPVVVLAFLIAFSAQSLGKVYNRLSQIERWLQWLTGGASGLRDVPAFSVPGFSFDNHVHYYYFVWAMVLLVVGSSVAVARSPFGRTLIAIHSDETAAKTFGIDCARYKVRAYVLSACFASLAGSLFAHYMGFLAPDDFGVMTSINILVMLYLGGIGTIYGPALGAVFLKLLPEFTYQFQDYELLLNGIILIVVLVFMPKGLFGILTGIKERVFARSAR